MTNATISGHSALSWQYEIPATGGIVVGFDGSPGSHAAIETAAVTDCLVLQAFFWEASQAGLVKTVHKPLIIIPAKE